jgi:hypothetical protein
MRRLFIRERSPNYHFLALFEYQLVKMGGGDAAGVEAFLFVLCDSRATFLCVQL